MIYKVYIIDILNHRLWISWYDYVTFDFILLLLICIRYTLKQIYSYRSSSSLDSIAEWCSSYSFSIVSLFVFSILNCLRNKLGSGRISFLLSNHWLLSIWTKLFLLRAKILIAGYSYRWISFNWSSLQALFWHQVKLLSLGIILVTPGSLVTVVMASSMSYTITIKANLHFVWDENSWSDVWKLKIHSRLWRQSFLNFLLLWHNTFNIMHEI